MIGLADRSGFGFHKHFVLQAQVARGRREDGLAPDEDFFAARHGAAHIVLADEHLNFNCSFCGKLGFFCDIKKSGRWSFGRSFGNGKAAEEFPASTFRICGRAKKAVRDFGGDGRRAGRFFRGGNGAGDFGRRLGRTDFGAPLPRAIPCAARTFSTTRAIAARSTPEWLKRAASSGRFLLRRFFRRLFLRPFASAEACGTPISCAKLAQMPAPPARSLLPAPVPARANLRRPPCAGPRELSGARRVELPRRCASRSSSAADRYCPK